MFGGVLQSDIPFYMIKRLRLKKVSKLVKQSPMLVAEVQSG
jgi:hypothetical protein